MDGRKKDYYRYNTAGFNIGGPAYIPGKFNRNKDKLFFFVGIEWQKQLVPQGLHNVTVPTAAERDGRFLADPRWRRRAGHDFRSRQWQAALPRQCHPQEPVQRGRRQDPELVSRAQRRSAIDPSYNYQTSNSNTYPRREEIYRGDYNINDKWKTYARYIRNKDETSMAYGQWNASYNIPFGPMSFGAPGWSFVANVTTIINPTLTNEFVFGSSRNDLHITPITDAFNASKVGVSYTMPFPDADKLKLVQNWNFGGVPNAPTTGFAGTPFLNFNHTYDITDSVAKVHDTHTIKAGIYLHKSLKDQTAFTSVNGIINFDRDANNPLDSQLGLLERAARKLRHAAAVQPGAERPIPLVERRMVRAGQLARQHRNSPWNTASGSTGCSRSTTRLSRPPHGTRDCTTRPRTAVLRTAASIPTAIASPSIL